MKNSKLLSLLTAGALVVSSFSGLVMNGGVARAAIVGAYDNTGAALAEIGDGDEAYILANEAGDSQIEVGVAAVSTHYFAGATTAADGVAGQVVAQAVEYNGMTFGMDNVDADTDEITVTKGTGQKDAVITYENAAAFTGAKNSITVHQLDAALYDADTDEKAKAKYTLDIRVDGGTKTFKLNTAMVDGADTWTLMGDGKDSFDVLDNADGTATVSLSDDFATGAKAFLKLKAGDMPEEFVELLAGSEIVDITNEISYVSDSVNAYYDQSFSYGASETKTFTIKPTTYLKGLFGSDLKSDVIDATVTYTLAGDYDGFKLARYDGTTLNNGYQLDVKSLAQGVTVIWSTDNGDVEDQPVLIINGTVTADDGTVYVFDKSFNLFRESEDHTVQLATYDEEGDVIETIADNRYLKTNPISWFDASYNEEVVSIAATDLTGAAVAGDNVTAIYELYDTTYVKLDGDHAGKRVTIVSNAYNPAGDASERAYLRLTDAGKSVTTNVNVDMKVTLINSEANVHTAGNTVDYNNGGDDQVDVRFVRLVIKGKTDFEVALVDELGATMPETIAWDIDDMAAATKAPKIVQVRALNNVNIGANGTAATVVFTMTGDTANFGIESTARYDALGNWDPVATDPALPSVENVNNQIFRIWTDGTSDKTATLKMVVNAGSNRAVAYYTLTTKIASLDITTWDTLAVGETLDLTSDVTVKYNGEVVTDAISWDVDAMDSQIKYLNKKITVTKGGKNFKITATYKKGVNTTAVATKTIKTVEKLSVSPASLKLEVGESVNISDMAISGGDGKGYVWDILEGENIATTTGKVLKANAAGDAKVRVKDATGNYAVVAVTVSGGVTPGPDPSEHYAGEPVKEDGVSGYLNEDLQTVTVTDAVVTSKAITIPATVQGFPVVAIDPQAFKKTNATTVYVVGSVEELGKGAFKASKVKKVYFSDPAALKTVGKNAFKKTNAKVVGVGAAFSDEVASDLKKAGASKVKNNGTAK